VKGLTSGIRRGAPPPWLAHVSWSARARASRRCIASNQAGPVSCESRSKRLCRQPATVIGPELVRSYERCAFALERVW
jgi:hypothetical protein